YKLPSLAHYCRSARRIRRSNAHGKPHSRLRRTDPNRHRNRPCLTLSNQHKTPCAPGVLCACMTICAPCYTEPRQKNEYSTAYPHVPQHLVVHCTQDHNMLWFKKADGSAK